MNGSSLLNIGIIGLGVGEQHLIAYQNHSDCNVKAIFDFIKNVKTSVIAKYPSINFVNSENDILYDPEIDVVTIASWDNYHYNQIIKALENGNIFLLKNPMSLRKSC